jgi:hypothetical protein
LWVEGTIINEEDEELSVEIEECLEVVIEGVGEKWERVFEIGDVGKGDEDPDGEVDLFRFQILRFDDSFNFSFSILLLLLLN